MNQISNTESGAVSTNLERLSIQYPGILFIHSKVTFGAIQDGTSNTFLLSERDGADMGYNGTKLRTRAAATWCGAEKTEYQNAVLAAVSAHPKWTINSTSVGATQQYVAVTSQHSGGANFARADGSVEFVSEIVDGLTYEAMGSKADGEVISN